VTAKIRGEDKADGGVVNNAVWRWNVMELIFESYVASRKEDSHLLKADGLHTTIPTEDQIEAQRGIYDVHLDVMKCVRMIDGDFIPNQMHRHRECVLEIESVVLSVRILDNKMRRHNNLRFLRIHRNPWKTCGVWSMMKQIHHYAAAMSVVVRRGVSLHSDG
jgi:hypothetical protein